MLKTVLESLDGLEEAVAKLYEEKDEKFILKLQGVDDHPEVVNLKSAYSRVKEDKETLKSEVDALKGRVKGLPEDFDLKVWEEAKRGKSDEAAQLSLRQEYEDKIADLKTQLSEEKASNRKMLLDRELSEHLTKAGVTKPALLKAAQALIAPSVKIGEQGAYVETDMGPRALGDYVSSYISSEGKDFATPPGGGGAGGGKSSTKKKFSEMTSTEKVNLHRENPDEYNRLKAEAT